MIGPPTGSAAMYSLLKDLRSGFRLLTKAPGLAIFAAVAITMETLRYE